MATMTPAEQVQLAQEIVREDPADLRDAYQTAVRQWQAASSAADINRWKATLDLYRSALDLREAVSLLR